MLPVVSLFTRPLLLLKIPVMLELTVIVVVVVVDLFFNRKKERNFWNEMNLQYL